MPTPLNNEAMNHLTFQNRVLEDKTIPAFVRLVASKALNDLRKLGTTTIRVEPFEFWQLVKHSGSEPIKSGMYTFIRVVNDNNYVDIQTLNS